MRATIVGAGPNGLAAALTLARAGLRVTVLEAADRPGGGLRSAELTVPGFVHDICASVQAFAGISPFLRGVDLDALGVVLAEPEYAFAHPLDGRPAVLVGRDVDASADRLGRDARAYRLLLGPLARRFDALAEDILGDLRHLPRHPLLLARFGLPGLAPATLLARTVFHDDPARALLAGAAAHTIRRLDAPLTAAFGLTLAAGAHATGWPVVTGGSERLAEALVGELRTHGVEIVTDHRVGVPADLPAADVTLLDLTPRQLLELAASELSPRYRRGLAGFRYGPGAFKIDYALSGPVPWADPSVAAAGTVHLGGTLDEIAASEADAEAGRDSEHPFVLAVQAGVADPSRGHTLWAYCHVPSGSTLDRTAAVERQLERFAPGFRDVVIARHTRTAAQYERYNGNYVGGDINSGRAGLFQSVLGPVPAWSRYRVPLSSRLTQRVGRTYLCSSSTPPGGGVHGMCGYNAAREALNAMGLTGRSDS